MESPLTVPEEIEEDFFFWKLFSLFVILGISLFFGHFPIIFKTFSKSGKIIGFANAFSGGIFMGISLFHLLPESSEAFEKYFDESSPDSPIRSCPNSFLLAFFAYALILFIEKVAFDTHSLVEHHHGEDKTHLSHVLGDHQHDHEHDHDHENGLHALKVLEDKQTEPFLGERDIERTRNGSIGSNVVKTQKKYSEQVFSMPNQGGFISRVSKKTSEELPGSYGTYSRKIMEELEPAHDSDEDEQALKNVITSKGKFASFLQARNLMQTPNNPKLPDRALFRASKMINRATSKNYLTHEDKDCVTNMPYPYEGKEEEDLKRESPDVRSVHSEHRFLPKSHLTPYLLLIALSMHGLFEGIALGIQNKFNDVVFLTIAILSHKWAEALSLGVSFFKANTEKGTFIRMLCLFSVFTPIGILIGILLAHSSLLIEAIFLAISSGTFLYISASEVVIEEFAITKYKYTKFIFLLIGALLVAGLAYIEEYKG